MSAEKHTRENLADVVSMLAEVHWAARRTGRTIRDVAEECIKRVGPRNGRGLDLMAKSFAGAAIAIGYEKTLPD